MNSFKQKKTSEEMLASIEQYMPEDVKENERAYNEEVKRKDRAEKLAIKKEKRLSQFDLDQHTDIICDTEDDIEFSRAHIRTLLEKGTESLDRLMDLADQMDHPRAFEVLANMLKTMGSLNHDLIDLQKKRKEVRKSEVVKSSNIPKGGGGDSTTYVFNGTTADMQRNLKQVEESTDV